MEEQKIAQSLLQTVPQRNDEPIAVPPPPPAKDEDSSYVQDAVSELGLLKISNVLGIDRPTGDAQEKLRYIYEEIASRTSDKSQESVLSTLNDYLIRLGFAFREDRFLKLYLWLKLNNEKQALESEMASL